MAAAGVVDSSLPTTPTPIEGPDVSVGQSFIFPVADPLPYAWWRFTAPADGTYGFDGDLTTLDGVSTADMYILMTPTVAPGSPHSFTIGSAHLPDAMSPYTTFAWADMLAGDQLDIALTAVSSLADYGADTLRPVNLVLRSSGLGSVVHDPPAIEYVADGLVSGTDTASISQATLLTAGVEAGDYLCITAVTEASADAGQHPIIDTPDSLLSFSDWANIGVSNSFSTLVYEWDGTSDVSVVFYGSGTPGVDGDLQYMALRLTGGSNDTALAYAPFSVAYTDGAQASSGPIVDIDGVAYSANGSQPADDGIWLVILQTAQRNEAAHFPTDQLLDMDRHISNGTLVEINSMWAIQETIAIAYDRDWPADGGVHWQLASIQSLVTLQIYTPYPAPVPVIAGTDDGVRRIFSGR